MTFRSPWRNRRASNPDLVGGDGEGGAAAWAWAWGGRAKGSASRGGEEERRGALSCHRRSAVDIVINEVISCNRLLVYYI